MKKILIGGAVATLALALGPNADAAQQMYGFNSGTAAGWRTLDGVTWNEHGAPATYKANLTVPLTGTIKFRSKITEKYATKSDGAGKCNASGYWMNSGTGWKRATYEARCKLTGGASGSDRYSWAAWWVSNGKSGAPGELAKYEIDMMECSKNGNYFNYWVARDNTTGSLIGGHGVFANSFNWRNTWTKYKAEHHPTNVYKMKYYIDGTWKQTHTVTYDRTGEVGDCKLQNRTSPGPCREDNADVQEIRALLCDWVKVTY